MLNPFYLLFAFLPSFAWLLFYLRKDAHPESNWMILRIFFFGMLVSFPVILVEIGFFILASKIPFSLTTALVLNTFIGIALTEEAFKYLVVRYGVLFHPELDEPIDVMLYLIIAALGFAASENILLLLRVHPLIKLPEVLSLTAIRFIGATFLHGLCSATIGFFLALSLLKAKNRLKLVWLGLGIATILHGLYNFSIIVLGKDIKFIIPVAILIGLALFVSLGFKKLKGMKSVCDVPLPKLPFR